VEDLAETDGWTEGFLSDIRGRSKSWRPRWFHMFDKMSNEVVENMNGIPSLKICFNLKSNWRGPLWSSLFINYGMLRHIIFRCNEKFTKLSETSKNWKALKKQGKNNYSSCVYNTVFLTVDDLFSYSMIEACVLYNNCHYLIKTYT